MEAYTTKHKDGTTVTYTGKKPTMSEIIAKTDKKLTHTHNFIFLFANGYKAAFPIDCYVEVINIDAVDTNQKIIIRQISAGILKTVFKKQPHNDTDALWVLDALLNSNCFVYTHEFNDPMKMFTFYFVQSDEFSSLVDFNRYNLVTVSIEGYIHERLT